MDNLADALREDFLETVKQDCMSLYLQCFRESCRENDYVIIGSMLIVVVFAVIQGIVT